MSDRRDEVTALIRADRLEAAVDRLQDSLGQADPEVAAELTDHRRTLERARRQTRRGLMTEEDEGLARRKVTYALLELIGAAADLPVAPDEDDSGEGGSDRAVGGTDDGNGHGAGKKAFISYSHQNREEAARLAEALRSAGIGVIIDDRAMAAGEGIEGFIRKSIAEADVTVSLVSRASLLSAWVAQESLTAFESGRHDRSKRFIAGYLDDDFFELEFRLKATREINRRLEEIEQLLPQYAEEKIDPVDLNLEKTRLFKLRNELGEILLRLKEHLTLDLRPESFEASVARLIDTIQGQDRPGAAG